MVVVDQEEVVEIPADLPRRVHDGVELKFLPVREGRKEMGQHGGLYVLRQRELRRDALPFGRDPGDVPDVMIHLVFHAVDGVRQQADLVLIAHRLPEPPDRRLVLLGKARRLIGDVLDGTQYHAPHERALAQHHDDDDAQQPDKHIPHKRAARQHDGVQRPAHAEDGLDRAVRSRQGDHGVQVVARRLCFIVIDRHGRAVRFMFV